MPQTAEGGQEKAMKRVVAPFMFLLLVMPAFAQQPCTKVVSFGYMAPTPQGARLIHYNIPDGTSHGWINNWVRKNAQNYPDVCFLPNPLRDHANFLVVLSDSPSFFSGFQVTTVYNTSTSFVSGSGTATNNFGGTWNFTYYGNVTTTTTTQENVPYEIHTNVLYANTYSDDGTLVSQRSHVYSTQTGGDPYAGLGYNMGNAFRTINAKGRLIASAIQDIAGPAQKKAKSNSPPPAVITPDEASTHSLPSTALQPAEAPSSDPPRQPDLSGLGEPERQSIESVCATAKFGQPPEAYNGCLKDQLNALATAPRRPDLSEFTEAEKQYIEGACVKTKINEGPAAYNRCLIRQLELMENPHR